VQKVSEQQNIPDTRTTTADDVNQQMLILQLLFQFTHDHNRPHVCTTPLLSAQSTRHVLATNSDNHASPRIRTQGTNLPELHHYPNLAVRTQEFQSQSPWGELNKTEGTSSVQVPSLSYSREQNHTGGLKPFSRSDMPLWHCRPKYHLA